MGLKGRSYKVETGCGTLHITVNREEGGDIVETFLRMGKSGTCIAVFLEALSRMIGLALRHSIPVEDVIEELKGMRCPSGVWDEGVFITSCVDAVGNVLEKESKNGKAI